MSPLAPADAVPSSSVAPGEARDERIGRGGDELRRRPALEDPAVDDHADLVGERGGILEVVGDEDGRQRELAEQLVELDPHRRLRVGVERRQRLVEQEDARLERERPRERDPLALAARQLADAGRRQMGDPEPLEQLGHGRVAAGAEAHVREHVEVGEQRVLLEQVAHLAALRRHVDALPRCRARCDRRAPRRRSGAAAARRRPAAPSSSRLPTDRRAPSWRRRGRSAGRTRRSYEGDG